MFSFVLPAVSFPGCYFHLKGLLKTRSTSKFSNISSIEYDVADSNRYIQCQYVVSFPQKMSSINLLYHYITSKTYHGGTQREYTSKPLKHSIVTRSLVLKRLDFGIYLSPPPKFFICSDFLAESLH